MQNLTAIKHSRPISCNDLVKRPDTRHPSPCQRLCRNRKSYPCKRHTGEGRYPELADNIGFPRVKHKHGAGSSSRFAEIYPANTGRNDKKVIVIQSPGACSVTEVEQGFLSCNWLILRLYKQHPPPAPPPAGDIMRKSEVTRKYALNYRWCRNCLHNAHHVYCRVISGRYLLRDPEQRR